VESLFNAYFCKGQDVGNVATLAVIAASCGLQETQTEAVLSGTGELGGQLNEEIDLQLQRAMELGVSGVPGYVMGGGYLLPGAQSVETMRAIIARAKEKFST
jgi:predicted DsbA family dithiol-disulfide isomerase